MLEKVLAGVIKMIVRVVLPTPALILMLTLMTLITTIANFTMTSLKRMTLKVTSAVVIVDINIVTMNIISIVNLNVVNMSIINSVKVIIVGIVSIITIKNLMSIGRLKVIKATLILVDISSVQ